MLANPEPHFPLELKASFHMVLMSIKGECSWILIESHFRDLVCEERHKYPILSNVKSPSRNSLAHETEIFEALASLKEDITFGKGYAAHLCLHWCLVL